MAADLRARVAAIVNDEEWASLDAVGHIELLRSGAISAHESVTAAAERLERTNQSLNVLATSTLEDALDASTRARTGGSDAVGVPMMLKDYSAQQAGVAYYAGSAMLARAGWRSTFDAHLVARLKDHGFVSLGRTNTPEFAMSPVTETEAFGATRNPWNPARSAGGSSGGSAAAVAAGIVPVAHGNDGGGSLRMPAAACGIVGLKPTRGRMPMGPHPAERAALAVTEGFVTRTVRDAALMLDVAGGRGPGDLASAPAPQLRYSDLLERPSPSLHIRLTVKAFNGAEVDAECVDAARTAATVLTQMGHMVEECDSSILSNPQLAMHAAVRGAVMAAATLERWGTALGRPVTEDDVEPATWESAQIGRSLRADAYALAITDAWRIAREIHEWWTGFDVLVTPTTARVADLVAGPASSLGALTERARPWRAFTPVFNTTGQPAISLPLAVSTNGLPIGVQLVAAAGREDHLLALGRALEREMPWNNRRPVVWAGSNENGSNCA